MAHHISDDLFNLTPGVNARQILEQGLPDHIHLSLTSSAIKDSAMDLLSSLGPKANILGNDYTKHLAMSGLAANQNFGWNSFSEQMKDMLNVSLLKVNMEDISGVSSAMSALALSGTRDLVATASLATNTPPLGATSGSVADIINAHFEKSFAGIRKSFQAVFNSAFKQFDFTSLRRVIFPPNLVDLDPEFILDDVWEFVQEYGVPLMYVPRARIAARLLRSKDKPAVRAILGQEFDNIVDDCEVAMHGLTWDNLYEHRDFALEAIGTIRSGHTMAAQALLTVLLDTLAFQLRPIADTRRFSKAITAYHASAPKEQVEIEDELTMKVALVWFPIREVHYKFQKNDFENIPRDYGRHVSVHGVHKRQFSKRNCVQALMVVCSLMAHADDLARRGI